VELEAALVVVADTVEENDAEVEDNEDFGASPKDTNEGDAEE
jgi:hypothetical protein